VKTGGSLKCTIFRPLSRAPASSYWHVNLGLAPQALCLRLLSQAKKPHSISAFWKADLEGFALKVGNVVGPTRLRAQLSVIKAVIKTDGPPTPRRGTSKIENSLEHEQLILVHPELPEQERQLQ
jgi:hypothetical protein